MAEYSNGSIEIEEVIDIYLHPPYYPNNMTFIVVLYVTGIVTLENNRPQTAICAYALSYFLYIIHNRPLCVHFTVV